jgi:hypothetical protein
LSLLVEEVKVGGTLVGDIVVKGCLDLVLIPLDISIPVVVLIILIILVIEGEVGFLSSILAF